MSVKSVSKRKPLAAALTTLLALTAAAVLATNVAVAEELMSETFEAPQSLSVEAQAGITQGRDGAGWTQTNESFKQLEPVFIERDVNFGRIERGMISFDLQRKVGQNPAEPRSIFALKNKTGENLLLAQITWQSAYDPEKAMLTLLGAPYYRNGIGLWSPWNLIDKKIDEGQWVRIELFWDDAQRIYKLYIDGQEQNTEPKSYSAALKKELPDPRISANKNNQKYGLAPSYFAKPFGDLVEQTASILLGANLSKERKIATSPLSNAVLDNFAVVSDEKLEELHTQAHDVRNLKSRYIEQTQPGGATMRKGIELTWEPPEIHGIDQSYVVYRRNSEASEKQNQNKTRFEKLTKEPITALTFLDESVEKGKTYRYAVAALYKDLRGRNLESKYPPETTATASLASIDAVAAEKTLYGTGQEIVVTIRGTKGLHARYSIESVIENAAAEEIDQGIYVGKIQIPQGLNLEKAKLSAALLDAQGTEQAAQSGPGITIDQNPPERIDKIIATIPWGGEIEIGWEKSPSVDTESYLVYRGEGTDPDQTKEPYEQTKSQNIIDLGAIAGIEYRYLVVPVDRAGNKGPASDIAAAVAQPGEGPEITGISLEPFGKSLKPGESATITVLGQSGGQCLIDIGTLAEQLELKEQGRTGKYQGLFQIEEKYVQPEKSLHRIIATLTDPYASAQFAGPELAVVGQNQLNDQTPPEIEEITHNAFQASGFSGVLVPGDQLQATLKGETGCRATFRIEGGIEGQGENQSQSILMEETKQGLYQGTYTIGWNDQGEKLRLTATLSDEAGNETSAEAEKTLTIDPRVRLSVRANKKLLPADKESKTRIIVEARNANGDKIKGHEISLALTTTEDYTGVVGGGALEGRKATKEDEDDLEIKWGGITDNFGQVTADYTAGNAAKTAIIIAKDLTTGKDVGFGWVNTYIAAQTTIILKPRSNRNAQSPVELTMWAEPAKLTADGRSKSRIKVRLTGKADNKPIEGKTINFALGSENGRLKILRSGRTDASGIAEAEYRAGTAMGTVTITASISEYKQSASIDITLMSDAPAKIALNAEAKELPADATSETELLATVSDVNDNPNNLAPIQMAIIEGSGKIEESELLTDKNGEAQTKYKAGSKPGPVTIEARHVSRAPTRGEQRRMLGTIYVPRLESKQERDRIKIAQWLVEPGEEIKAGQDLAVLESRKGVWTIKAPWDGVFVRRTRHERDEVELGDAIGYLEVDTDAWQAFVVE